MGVPGDPHLAQPCPDRPTSFGTLYGTGAINLLLPEFAWPNVYEHRLTALTLPGQRELWNKELEFALR